jgi:ankyrin repeat protein
MNWPTLIKTGTLRELRQAFKDGQPNLARDSRGYPLLHHACMRQDGGFRAARALLDAGADPNERDTARFRQTPLHLAAEQGDLELAELLLERGARPDEPDAWGNGPVWKALHTGGLEVQAPRRGRYVRMVQLLVRHGADLDRLNDEGKSPRHHLRHPWCAELREI